MIGFAGMTHLGIVSSAAAARLGFDVVAVDPERSLSSREYSEKIFEPGLDELLASIRAGLSVSSDMSALKHCPLVFLSLDITTTSDGISDLTEFDRLVSYVGEILSPDSILVILSQVPPGTTRYWDIKLRDLRGGRALKLYYQAETLIFGHAVDRACSPERLIVGCSDPKQSIPRVYAEYLAAFRCPIIQMGFESAELCKLAINCFLVSSIATTNLLADVASRVGGTWTEISEALRLDRRIGTHAYLSPGLGLGGSNLVRDLATLQILSRRVGSDATLIDSWLTSSSYHRDWALRHLHASVLNRVDRPLLGVWGLSYKVDTSSTINSPALNLITAVAPVPVHAYDPRAELVGLAPANLTRIDDPLAVCLGIDALLVLTPWKDFATISLMDIRERMRGNIIIDPFGVFDHEEAQFLGFHHFQLGIPSPSATELIDEPAPSH